MAMTQEESGALMQSAKFRDRVQVCIVKYGDSILTANSIALGHVAMENWAKQALENPSQMAMRFQPAVVNDGAVQDAGVDDDGKALVGDPELQSAVEATVNKTF